MKIAIMQPYFYPYLLYWQMIKSVDTFVLLTDVQYLRRGWINRNRIRSPNGCGWLYLTVPVVKAPVNTNICCMKTMNDGWGEIHRKTLLHTYGKKINNHWLFGEFCAAYDERDLCTFLCRTLTHTARNLGLTTNFVDSRTMPSDLRKDDRIIELCKLLNTTEYINLPGGVSLYDPEKFRSHNINLTFMEPLENGNNLSIIDLCLGDGLEKL